MMANSGVRQHKTMAGGGEVAGEGSNFGVQPFHEVNGGHEHPDMGMDHRPMKDHERSAGMPISRGRGKMPATPHSDHGPHHHMPGRMGVEPMSGVQGNVPTKPV